MFSETTPSTRLRALTALIAEVADLKRIRTAGSPHSMATRLFSRAWDALLAGEPLEKVALHITATAVAGARLAGIDADVLRGAGLGEPQVLEVLRRAFDEVAGALQPALAAQLRAQLGEPLRSSGRIPRFVEQLAGQPRAGATKPGQPRLILDPTENHADHSLGVAVNAVLVAPMYDALPAEAFFAGLIHHLQNAGFPDAGFAGEALLGEHLATVFRAYREASMAEVPEELHPLARRLVRETEQPQTPASRAFNAGDVLDRVLQQQWHARAAAFTLEHAMEEMEIVHAGPVQAFHHDVLREAGLMP